MGDEANPGATEMVQDNDLVRIYIINLRLMQFWYPLSPKKIYIYTLKAVTCTLLSIDNSRFSFIGLKFSASIIYTLRRLAVSSLH